MINKETKDFIDRWFHKADTDSGNPINNAFDKFYAQFVIYNKLYVEAFNCLASSKPGKFIDSEASSKSVVDFLGADQLWNELVSQKDVKNAIDSIESILDQTRFYISLDITSGNHLPDKDVLLLRHLRSDVITDKATALLKIIYRVRCNLVHGRKQFVPDQLVILEPSNIILRKVIEILSGGLLVA
ncbi:MAG: hypothetical protein HY964_10745 [Ignavibacteriales bacterium]|nr:hypothetical protein [Ignavibacteriales bacterium]